MRLPYIDRIWRVQGQLPLDAPLQAADAFARLGPLFQTPGTDVAIDGDVLTYRKRNPAAQDKLATFTRGRLGIEDRAGATVLHFDVSSTALLLCFLAPLLFLAFGQLAEVANAWEKADAEEVQKTEKDEEKPKPKPTLNPIDQMLGAPEPEDPAKKQEKDKAKDKDKGKHSPTPAYVLAGLFALIYLVGRVLEPWLLKRTLTKALAPDGANVHDSAAPLVGSDA
jgi:hypothetical protein